MTRLAWFAACAAVAAFAAVLMTGCSRSSNASTAPVAAAVKSAAAPIAPPGRKHDSDEAERRLPSLPLTVRVNGQPAAPWRPTDVAAIPTTRMQNKQGQAREAWPVDELAHRLVGANARVVALANDEERFTVGETQGRTLVLRVTRDGEYKAQWSGSGDAVLHDVRAIELER